MAGRPSSPELTNEEVFGQTKGDPTETYIELLRRAETDMESAEWLARKLGQNQDSARAFIHINRLAHDPSLEIRRLGVIAMAYCHSFGNRDASKYVQHLMNDPDEGTRAVLAHHPAWRLLASDHAPLVASFLNRFFVAPNVRAMAAAGRHRGDLAYPI